MLHCLLMKCLKLKSLKLALKRVCQQGRHSKCCTAEEKPFVKIKEQVSGEPFSLFFFQPCINHITKHKRESFRNQAIYLLLSERRLWCM